jgi:hypothetical protein
MEFDRVGPVSGILKDIYGAIDAARRGERSAVMGEKREGAMKAQQL